MDRFDKDISFLESVDRDPILKELCRQYSVYSFDEKFRVIAFPISDLIKRNYEAGYFLSNYPYVLSLYGVRDEQMDNLSTEGLPYLATLACLTWHFRRDYFCQGTLTYRSIAEGTLLRLFCHLRELYKKNPTVSTLEELHRTKCSSLPCQPGIYRVLAPEKLPISFIEGSDNLRAKGYPAAILEQKYGQCTDKTVLYIGKANGRGGLRQRVLQYVKYGWGTAVNHKGGRAIWQVKDYPLLLLEYEVCENCEQREHELLAAYKKENGTYPLANWRG